MKFNKILYPVAILLIIIWLAGYIFYNQSGNFHFLFLVAVLLLIFKIFNDFRH